MIAPILRLVLIYLALIAAVLAVFNRDRLAGMFSDEAPRSAAMAPALVAPPAAPPPARMPTPIQPQPGAPATMPGQDAPLYGSDLQAPVVEAPAPSPAAPAASAAPDMQAAIASAVNAARAVFWSGDVEGARAQMLALARAHPDNADLLGELGNLQFALRDFPAAADAWYRAGLALLEQGQLPQQRGFMQALAMIDPEKAADLATRAQGH